MPWSIMDPARDTEYQRAKALLATADPGDHAAALALLDAGAGAGHPPSCCRLAELLLDGDDPAAWPRGLALLRQAAEARHAPACFRLGLAFAKGAHGLAADPAAAAHWCALAAQAGLGVAQFNLGLLHAAGSGVPADAQDAARWLRLAAVNGVAEADGCLEVLYREPTTERPRTWEEAETRASVALERSDPQARKSMRFAEYYVDPCLDLLQRQLRLQRAEVEDIVQQFFLELEEPLERGRYQGQRWKEALRGSYVPRGSSFRPFLARALVNFARDWLRRRPAAGATSERPAKEDEVERQGDRWRALLARFAADTAPRRPDAARAVAVIEGVLVQDQGQAAIAARLAVSDRTVRTSLRLGAELLRNWLQRQLPDPPPADDAVADALRRGLAEIPAWLHGPSADKRRRLLLYLALVGLYLERQAPTAG